MPVHGKRDGRSVVPRKSYFTGNQIIDQRSLSQHISSLLARGQLIPYMEQRNGVCQSARSRDDEVRTITDARKRSASDSRSGVDGCSRRKGMECIMRACRASARSPITGGAINLPFFLPLHLRLRLRNATVAFLLPKYADRSGSTWWAADNLIYNASTNNTDSGANVFQRHTRARTSNVTLLSGNWPLPREFL